MQQLKEEKVHKLSFLYNGLNVLKHLRKLHIFFSTFLTHIFIPFVRNIKVPLINQR